MSLYKILVQGKPKKIIEELKKNVKIINQPFIGSGINEDHQHLTPLMLAAALGLDNVAEIMITMGAMIHDKVKQGNAEGYDACMFAIESGRKNFVSTLIKKGFDPKAVISSSEHAGMTYLVFAVARGETEIVKLLHQAGAKIDAFQKTAKGPASTSYHLLSNQEKNEELIDYFIANTKKLESFFVELICYEKIWIIPKIIAHYRKTIPDFKKSAQGYILLSITAMSNKPEIAKFIEADVNFVPDIDVQLKMCHDKGTRERNKFLQNMMRFFELLEIDNPQLFLYKYYQGLSVLAVAILWDATEFVQAFIAKGADVNYVIQVGPFAGMPILAIAVLTQNEELIHLLCAAGANLNAKIIGVKLNASVLPEMTVFELALGFSGKYKTSAIVFVTYLFKDEIEIQKNIAEKKLPFLFAIVLAGNFQLTKFFIENGDNVNEPVSHGEYNNQTPLQAAILIENLQIVTLLIQSKVDVNRLIPVSGKLISPLDCAVQTGNQAIIDLLRSSHALTTDEISSHPSELETAYQLVKPFAEKIKLYENYKFFNAKSVNENRKPKLKTIIFSPKSSELNFKNILDFAVKVTERNYLINAGIHCDKIIKILNDIHSFQSKNEYSLLYEMLCYDRLQYHTLRLAVILRENIPHTEWEKYFSIVENIRLITRHLHYHLNLENLMKYSYEIYKAFNGLIQSKLGNEDESGNIQKDLSTSKLYQQLKDFLNKTAISKSSIPNCKKIIYYELVGIKNIIDPIDKPYKVKFYIERMEALKMKFCRIGECYTQMMAANLPLDTKLNKVLRTIRDQIGNIVAHEDVKIKTTDSLIEVDSQKIYELAVQSLSCIELIKDDIPELKFAETTDLIATQSKQICQ